MTRRTAIPILELVSFASKRKSLNTALQSSRLYRLLWWVLFGACLLLSRALIYDHVFMYAWSQSPQPANNQLNHVSSTTAQPSTLAKSTNDESIPSCTLSTLPRSTTLISDDPVLLASSPTTTKAPLTDHVPSITHPVADITNATSHKSNDSISSTTAKPYTRQPPRSSTNNSLSLSVKEHGDRKKEASTTTSSISNQLHTEDVDKFAVFLKQTLAQKDAARTAAVEEINTLRGKLQSQEKIIAEYKGQFQRLDQVSTSLSGKQDDMGQG